MSYHHFIVREKERWDDYIERSITCEAYHTFHYHSLNKEGEPILFVYQEGEDFIALPLIKRKIEDSHFYDMTSVYGYAGPIANYDLSVVSAQRQLNFKTAFSAFMEQEDCVSLFSRLYPFVNQHCLLENIGDIYDNGHTIYMDLSLSAEEQRKGYDKRMKRQIRKLRERNFLIKEADSQKEISAFTTMYRQNMDRLSATQQYYFDEHYFTALLQCPNFNNKLILVYDDTELICGALILVSKDIIRNHLSATAPNYVKESPSKLLTDEISVIGRELGAKIFHLGGGVNGKEDTLFEFKRYFSPLLVKDRIWCYISNKEVYDELVKSKSDDVDPESRFFPAYRQMKKVKINI